MSFSCSSSELDAENVRSVDQGLLRADAKIFVLPHQGAPEGVLDLLTTPELAHAIREILSDEGLRCSFISSGSTRVP